VFYLFLAKGLVTQIDDAVGNFMPRPPRIFDEVTKARFNQVEVGVFEIFHTQLYQKFRGMSRKKMAEKVPLEGNPS